VTTSPTDHGWNLHLDGKQVKTPEKSDLIFPTQNLATIARNEWKDQKETILPDTMPVTQMMMTVIDRVTPNRAKLQNEILDYIDTDLICYFTDEPEIYATAQMDAWQPVLEWIKSLYGTKPLTTSGLAALSQPENLRGAITTYVNKLDDLAFACLYRIVSATGSLFLGLAFLEKAFTNDEIFHATLVEDLIKDTIYLADAYGLSPDQEKKRKQLKSEIEDCKIFLNSWKGHSPEMAT